MIENGMVRRVAPYTVHVVEFPQLAFDLSQPLPRRHPQPNPAGIGVCEGHTENAVYIECAAGEESADMGHHAGMIVDGQFEYCLIRRMAVTVMHDRLP